MTLADYLVTAQLTQREFAEMIGTTQASVSRWVTDQRMPELTFLVAIKRATKGAVTADDFVERLEGTR